MLAHPSASVPKVATANSAGVSCGGRSRGAASGAIGRAKFFRCLAVPRCDERGLRAAARPRKQELGAETNDPAHIPVLLGEALEALSVKEGGAYIDATFGAGGYSRALLAADNDIRVLALDRDPDAIGDGQALVAQAAGRLTLVQARFGEIERVAREHGFASPDGVVFDLGISSMQIDRPERGFSFRHDGPLDMRMSREGLSAADLVATVDVKSLAHKLQVLGEERHAGRIAEAIVAAREVAPIRTTYELRRIVTSAVPPARDGIDPATRTFQALRISVNEELDELVRGMVGAASLLAPGGRLVAVSFHSLEDRLVKHFLQGRTAAEIILSRHLPTEPRSTQAFAPIGGPIAPSQTEIFRNPRSRSAKLRWGVRSSLPLPEDILRLASIAMPREVKEQRFRQAREKRFRRRRK
ncbi:MAG: 16S rRNA (cytosine(1402)-N(4))-methyltransferase RsmH [Hyphomicrobiales bacterium]|nr:16S rRNA (cytosine(1402)-N(4))-methyltransferase RsmH [Hyphomicrobiales bacterium]MBV9053596.1 16S rRNA (cytosine(1402)-N(4))-methyltransferase RsmH [Hyphomicrobiales bacterium]MBV9588634.1 16S rRNA (cytosine(1402)-N(4))-methyltransferase RsmH [Hyphomicrobiales bacterium]